MNTVERLMKVDAGKIKAPEKTVVMELKKFDGEGFSFPCRAVDAEYVAELQENSIEFSEGDIERIRMYDSKVLTIIEGCPSVFKDKSLRDHFGSVTPKDLVSKLLVSGEMDFLKKEIDKLGGYDNKKQKKNKSEVKN